MERKINWKKLTGMTIGIGFILYSIYDTIALIVGGKEATLSTTMYEWIYTIPVISFGPAMIIAHFYSFINIYYKSHKHYYIMAGISIAVIILSIITYKTGIKINPLIGFICGFIVGTTLWSQKNIRRI